MKQSLIIKNGFIVNADNSFYGDILIEDNIITRIEKSISGKLSDKIISAEGNIIFPGGVDAHVHMQLPSLAGPSSDDFHSGTMAAIAGGTTTIIDFVTPMPKQSLTEALNKRKAEAKRCITDYAFHMGITWWNNSLGDEIKRCVENEGIRSFKTYLAYKGTIGISEDELFNVMKTVASVNALVTVHCEKGETIEQNQKKFVYSGNTSPVWHARSRPPETEAESVKSVIKIAEETGCPVYIVHTSTAESIEMISSAKNKGLRIYSETCPQYLLLDESVYEKSPYESLKYIISPPIRAKKHSIALWEAIKNKNISVIATDHCPFNTLGQKDKGISDFTKIPNGAAGVENRLELMYTYGVNAGLISVNDFVALNMQNPAKIFGLYSQKGILAVGADADILIWNPNIRKIISAHTHKHRCDSSIYEGFEVTGAPETVICKGVVAYHRGMFDSKLPFGNYLFKDKMINYP